MCIKRLLGSFQNKKTPVTSIKRSMVKREHRGSLHGFLHGCELRWFWQWNPVNGVMVFSRFHTDDPGGQGQRHLPPDGPRHGLQLILSSCHIPPTPCPISSPAVSVINLVSWLLHSDRGGGDCDSVEFDGSDGTQLRFDSRVIRFCGRRHGFWLNASTVSFQNTVILERERVQRDYKSTQ